MCDCYVNAMRRLTRPEGHIVPHSSTSYPCEALHGIEEIVISFSFWMRIVAGGITHSMYRCLIWTKQSRSRLSDFQLLGDHWDNKIQDALSLNTANSHCELIRVGRSHNFRIFYRQCNKVVALDQFPYYGNQTSSASKNHFAKRNHCHL